MFQRTPNTYADSLKPYFGVPQIDPVCGQSFDRFNDLVLSACGEVVYHRDGHITNGTIRSVTSDALIEYNRRHMTRAAFDDCYGEGDERTESMMLHGANG
jgi:hypothetical protein